MEETPEPESVRIEVEVIPLVIIECDVILLEG